MTEQEMKFRITEKPYYTSWYNNTCGFEDSLTNEGVINYEGLSDVDKLRLYVFAWNCAGFLPGKNSVLKKFGWTDGYFKSVRKEAGLTTDATFSERTGLISGRGYVYEPKPVM